MTMTSRRRPAIALTLLALAWAPACSTQDAVAPPEGFVDVLETIGRFYDTPGRVNRTQRRREWHSRRSA